MTKKEAYFVFQSYWAETPMVRLYGHSWPIRWGAEGEEKMVKVYSNCETAELFVNGKSAGVKHRNSQDFPAAGLRWMTPFVSGQNTLRVVATKGGKTVIDEIAFLYQTETWGAPVELKLTEKSRRAVAGGETVTVEAKLYDAKGALCLDARNRLRFSIAGMGSLLDNRGTSKASRVVEMYNGRAEISLTRKEGGSVVAVSAAGIKPAFCNIA
jgi:beta-galactosidase